MKSSKNMKLVVLLTIVVLVVVAAVVIISNNKDDTTTTKTANQPSIEGQPTLGEKDAPVTVTEFGDFKCPSCKAWGEMVYPQLVKDYIDSGKVKLSFINVLFHGEESTLASIAAESVYKQAPDSYWDFHKALFNEQPEGHDTLWVTPEKILEVAKAFPEIDLKTLEEDMENQSTMDQVNIDEELVKEFNIELTPTIMINGTIIEDPFDYEKIKEVIDEELEGNK
jgi:protein-disulfide isomerase